MTLFENQEEVNSGYYNIKGERNITTYLIKGERLCK